MKTIFWRRHKKSMYSLICFFFSSTLFCQTYPPIAGVTGSTAIHKDSSVFINWASGCSIVRGYQDISNIPLGFSSVGDSSMALGVAMSNAVVSLGDGGEAICTFPYPITNGIGYDFAIFENGFDDYFLELAFVEVSSDGQNFVRFNAHSLTDTAVQIGSFDLLDATKINNLAGKYRVGFGTPFDLQELVANPLLNINSITHVKLIDCVGSLNNLYATKDSYNNKINEPWPTPFASSGFDLDAIGVIHQNTTTDVFNFEKEFKTTVFPQPAIVNETLSVFMDTKIEGIDLLDLTGRIIFSSKHNSFIVPQIPTGFYLMQIQTENKKQVLKIIINE